MSFFVLDFQIIVKSVLFIWSLKCDIYNEIRLIIMINQDGMTSNNFRCLRPTEFESI